VKLPLIGSIVEASLARNALAGASASEPLVPSPDVLSGVHVLVVDDDDDTLELLTTALRSRGAQVTGVSSVSQAIDAIRTSRPDVLVSDIAMPDEDGYQLIKKVIAMDIEPRIPAIAITAYAKEEDKERALAAGYQRYLTKPVELGEFISAVAELARMNSRDHAEAVFSRELMQVNVDQT